MKRSLLFTCTLLSTLALAEAAQAFSGYTTQSVRLRAGPGVEYPVVDSLRRGSRVNIHGCIEGWNWCEISDRRDRGWVSGAYLQTTYRNRRITIMEAPRVIEVPILTFSAGPYWDRYYTGRSFYRDRARWAPDRNDHDRNDRDRNDHGRGPDQDRHDAPRPGGSMGHDRSRH